MGLAGVAISLSVIGILVTGYLATIFVLDPVAGMARVDHLPQFLPQVMAGRYIAFALLAIGVTVSRNLVAISFLFAVFAFVSMFDAVVYLTAGEPFGPHLVAGLAAAGVALVALVAKLKGAPQ